jgi:hypothetical protein
MRKTCTDCIYKGKNLNYSKGPVIAEWISCIYPIPWHVESKAVPYRDILGNIIEHNCKVKKETTDVDINMDNEEVLGC